MAQTITALAVIALASYLLWRHSDRLFVRPGIKVALRLDKSRPVTQLIWLIVNTGATPVTLTKLIVSGRNCAGDTVPFGLPAVLAPQGRLMLPTNVDQTLLAARSVAVADASGHEHYAMRSQLVAIQNQLRHLIDRRAYKRSAADMLSGASDLAFGVVMLGVGFCMLMWVIAAG